jgi:hypothetical protein
VHKLSRPRFRQRMFNSPPGWQPHACRVSMAKCGSLLEAVMPALACLGITTMTRALACVFVGRWGVRKGLG